ncbi:MAG TPA: 2-oxoglutarate dehydrogenase E1 component, partial [Burkholderiales bacterium]|nr:2-oxoglutarate dehydrogenase E1 component [Burkholderiales bacterium]
MMKQMLGNSYLSGSNAPFIEALYEAYLKDPAAVEPRWRDYFDELQRLDQGAADVSHFEVQERFANLAAARRAGGPAVVVNRPQLGEKQFGVLQMISAYRILGGRHADIDPLKRREKLPIPELDPAFYGLTEADMEVVFNTGTLVGPREMKLKDLLGFLKDTYCR